MLHLDFVLYVLIWAAGKRHFYIKTFWEERQIAVPSQLAGHFMSRESKLSFTLFWHCPHARQQFD